MSETGEFQHPQSDLTALRKRLLVRSVFEIGIGGELTKVPCVCATDRKPCTYHEGVVCGVDAALDALEPEVTALRGQLTEAVRVLRAIRASGAYPEAAMAADFLAKADHSASSEPPKANQSPGGPDERCVCSIDWDDRCPVHGREDDQ